MLYFITNSVNSIYSLLLTQSVKNLIKFSLVCFGKFNNSVSMLPLLVESDKGEIYWFLVGKVTSNIGDETESETEFSL